MINPLRIMANLMKKFKRKRRLSSELHSRWGDTSISFPNQGSWNEWNQPSELDAIPPVAAPRHIPTDGSRRYVSMDPMAPQRSGESNDSRSRNIHPHADSVIPRGYFDENIRHRTDRSHRPSPRGLGINGSRHNTRHDRDHDPPCADESCDEDDEDEERDTLGDPGGLAHRGYATDYYRAGGRDDDNLYADRASKSPPLSVTSRMRRVSMQSSTTEHSSSAASRHTSYTGASSVSGPSMTPDMPRYAFNSAHAHAEKRAPRPRHREPEPMARQEMVPGYDELYG